jgi:hypothetical protein
VIHDSRKTQACQFAGRISDLLLDHLVAAADTGKPLPGPS